MGKMSLASWISVSSAFVIFSIAQAGPVEDLASVLQGRSGSASEDRREDVTGPFNVRIGCEGDTLEAHVKITGVSGNMSGDTASMIVSYNGSYERQGWDIPCQKVSSNLGGLEERHVYGKFHFTVSGKAFQKPTIAWGGLSNYGEITDVGHDSNQFAAEAVKAAITSALQ